MSSSRLGLLALLVLLVLAFATATSLDEPWMVSIPPNKGPGPVSVCVRRFQSWNLHP